MGSRVCRQAHPIAIQPDSGLRVLRWGRGVVFVVTWLICGRGEIVG